MFHFKSWLMVTPSNLALVTNSRGLPFRTRGSKSWLLLENPIRSSLHLAQDVNRKYEDDGNGDFENKLGSFSIDEREKRKKNSSLPLYVLHKM